MACFPSILFQWSERDPPIRFMVPERSSADIIRLEQRGAVRSRVWAWSVVILLITIWDFCFSKRAQACLPGARPPRRPGWNGGALSSRRNSTCQK